MSVGNNPHISTIIAELDRMLRGGRPHPRRSAEFKEIMAALDGLQLWIPVVAGELSARMLGLLAQQLDRTVIFGEGDVPAVVEKGRVA